jgi:hypothetical protein
MLCLALVLRIWEVSSSILDPEVGYLYSGLRDFPSTIML